MAYEWDIFLSYRRSNDWPRFVENHFLPKLEHWLATAIGKEPRIFVDVQQLEAGDDWPHELSDALAHSRTMVCLWTKQYFNSKWCAAELTQMMARRKASADGLGKLPPLIVAALIHDCEDLSDSELRRIQQFPMQKYCNPWLSRRSKTEERLAVEIEKLARHVADALKSVPPYDESWPGLISVEFMHLFNDEPTQDIPPSLGSTGS